MRASEAWRRQPRGLEIAVRVTPRASRDAFAAGTSEHFAARLAAPPVDGAANKALTALVARTFGVAGRAVTLTAGEGSRLKRLYILGDAVTLEGLAASFYGSPHDG
jgi:uncharacterized protein YggU (UPF0235/DUF167 family)